MGSILDSLSKDIGSSPVPAIYKQERIKIWADKQVELQEQLKTKF